MISQFDLLIRRETRKAIKAVLESSLSQGDTEDERRRQDRQSQAITDRKLHAQDKAAEAKDEAEEAEDKKSKDSKEKKREDRSKGKGTADSPKLKDPKAKQIENPTVASVVDKLNALRGGRSLNDPDVRKSFDQYFSGLTLPEKQSLLLFLTGIAQILAGTEVGKEALEPGDAGLRVKDTEKEQNKVKKDEKPDTKTGTEDNPIVVGEVASKHMIKKVLKAYRDNT